MVLYVILVLVVLTAGAVLGVLFFMLGQEGKKSLNEAQAVPVKDLGAFKEPFKQAALAEAPAPAPVIDDTYKKRAQELELELQAISHKAQSQLDEANHMIETLTKENESLKSQQADVGEAKQKLSSLEEEAVSLKAENAGLQNQLSAAGAKVQVLEQELDVVKAQMGEELSRANETIAQLTKEKESFVAAPAASDPSEGMRQEMNELQARCAELGQKCDELNQKCQDLEASKQKLQDLNTHLTEKSNAMEYELIKARAQTSGLERVSFNYKTQIEDFLKKVEAAETANGQLSMVKNTLEAALEEIRLQNEDLAKKDQLSQFELEKNRSRLINLEKEYADLKMRIPQKEEL